MLTTANKDFLVQREKNLLLTFYSDEGRYVNFAVFIDEHNLSWFESKKLSILFNYQHYGTFMKHIDIDETHKFSTLSNAKNLKSDIEFISEKTLNAFLIKRTKIETNFNFKLWLMNDLIPKINKIKFSNVNLKRPNNEIGIQTKKIKSDSEEMKSILEEFKTDLKNEIDLFKSVSFKEDEETIKNCIRNEFDKFLKSENINKFLKNRNEDLLNKIVLQTKDEVNQKSELDLLQQTLKVFKLPNKEYKFFKRQKRNVPLIFNEISEDALLLYSRDDVANNLNIIECLKLFLSEKILNIRKSSVWLNISIPHLTFALDKIFENQSAILDYIAVEKERAKSGLHQEIENEESLQVEVEEEENVEIEVHVQNEFKQEAENNL
ncbi:hypothetical protein NPIL_282881 [Nephila pilipes]|uniref:Bro-N domain-containing protein n=1 Tax=Nephila pilipes TaxID=299642 RepID=A0A8X6QZ20_NEPPI|nr:hypothetical protein NPIL_282881 [Nephila pilipes]